MRIYRRLPPTFSMLFSPIKIGHLVIKNRVVLAPMDVGMINPDGSLSERVINYYEERAKGGVGLIITQFTAVVDDQRMDSPGIFSGRQIFGLNYLVETIKEYNVMIFLQIAHHGGRAERSITGLQPVAPSAISSPLYKELPRELSKQEIQDLIEKFIQAAKRAKIAGFDGVEVHGAHTYLIGQFISPHTNRRKDEYGGDFEGRMRFSAEIVRGIKKECGQDFVIGFKFSAYEHVENGVKINLAKKIASYMEKLGVDYLHVASTTYELGSWKYPDVSPLYAPPGEVVELAQNIKAEVSIPVMAGGGINDPQLAEEILRQKKVDLVVLGRALIADPRWAEKVEKGEIEEILPCIRCNRCHKRLFSGQEVRCTVNPSLGRERKYQIKEVARTKKIVVVGGGPAGLEAALTLNKRGHRVILYEKEDKLGGNLVISSIPSFKKDVRRLLDYYLRKIEKSGVEVRLGKLIDGFTLMQENSDAIVIATGARHIIPEIPGLKKGIFHTASGVLKKHDEIEMGERVIILGAGLVGCEVAWYLSSLRKKVKIFELLDVDSILTDEHSTNRFYLLYNLKMLNVEILAERKIVGVENKKAIFQKIKEGREEVYPFDLLVIATGFRPRDELLGELKTRGYRGEIYCIGDCAEPRNLYHAIQEGAKIGREI